MEFTTTFNKKRPIRLSGCTRDFAWESLQGKYGDEAQRFGSVSMDDIENFECMPESMQYDACIRKIAEEAPLRICENELVSGAATLGMAISHQVPAKYKGKALWCSISHVTLGFDKVLKTGINAMEAEIDEQLKSCSLSTSQTEVLTGMKNAVTSMRLWHKRYLEALKNTKPEIYKNLLHVPFEPARNFQEAVQSLWFTFAFTRLCGNWSGIGRLDEMLGDYLKQDLESGRITLPNAREILASFFIKGCEWIQSDAPAGSGDAQHYQNIVLAGIGIDGKEITNEVTYLVLDIVEELGISDFPITVRVNENTPNKLLTRVAEVIRHGGGTVAVYNEPLILESMMDFGYPVQEARAFANDGCWEVQVPGKTYFIYSPFDSLQILLNDTLGLNSEPVHYDCYEDLYASFHKNLQNTVRNIYENTLSGRFEKVAAEEWKWSPAMPCPVVSLLTEGCALSGLSYLGGGAEYTVVSPHIGGAPDVGNSLYAINKLVFEEKKIAFDELMNILKNNWEGNEALRQYVLNKYTYYGNDFDEADRYTVRVLDDFAEIAAQLNKNSPILFPAGVSTFGRQIEWAPFRAAVPFGHRKGDILSANTSPSPGSDTEGATAIIKSYCKADLKKQYSGSALDIKLYPTSVQGANGTEALISLIKGFLKLGGFFMQLDVIDTEILRLAQKNPENYKNLSVRVSGWNSRFVTLSKEWQNMIIEQTKSEE